MKVAFRRKPSRPEAMSAFGPKRTSVVAPHMSAFGGKADIGQPPSEGISTFF